MSHRTRKRMLADEARIDRYQTAQSEDLPLREARQEAHQCRLDGFRVVLEYMGGGGWLVSGDWEAPADLYRVRLAV